MFKTKLQLVFFFEAKLMNELAITFYGSTGILSTIFNNLILIFRGDDIFRMIDNFEEFIEKRKLTVCININFPIKLKLIKFSDKKTFRFAKFELKSYIQFN